MLTTSLKLLNQYRACSGRYNHLKTALGIDYGYDQVITLAQILEHNGLSDAFWALRAVPDDQKAARDKFARLYACDCAERALPIFEAKYPDDKRPRAAIEIARQFAQGLATDEERLAARRDAADAAYAAADAADAAYAADAAADAYAGREKERAWQIQHFLEALGAVKVEA